MLFSLSSEHVKKNRWSYAAVAQHCRTSMFLTLAFMAWWGLRLLQNGWRLRIVLFQWVGGKMVIIHGAWGCKIWMNFEWTDDSKDWLTDWLGHFQVLHGCTHPGRVCYGTPVTDRISSRLVFVFLEHVSEPKMACFHDLWNSMFFCVFQFSQFSLKYENPNFSSFS